MSLPQNKRFAARRLLCLLLALVFGLALAGCGSSASSEPAAQDQEQVLTDDALYELTAEKVDQPLDGAGAAIALAVGAEGTDIGAGAAVWHGVQTFCSNFNYTAQQFTAADTSLDAAKSSPEQRRPKRCETGWCVMAARWPPPCMTSRITTPQSAT